MEAFIGSIMAFGFNFAPKDWALCAGQLMAISQNTALFSLIGTFYGGNGTSNFGLPDLQGRVACGMGQGPGLPVRVIGEQFGQESVALTNATLGQHTHVLQEKQAGQSLIANASDGVPDKSKPTGAYWGKAQSGTTVTPNYSSTHDTTMASDAVQLSLSNLGIGTAGGSQPFGISQPTLSINYCIALYGIFPSRS